MNEGLVVCTLSHSWLRCTSVQGVTWEGESAGAQGSVELIINDKLQASGLLLGKRALSSIVQPAEGG